MNVLVLIPARGGSKRVPGKNIRKLAGKPLIEWTIAAALGHEDVVEVLVSTDDPDIAAVAKAAGACVPWLRPEYLATDTAGSADVALHALDWFEAQRGAVDALLLLQPTSPLRRRTSVKAGLELFYQNMAMALVGVSAVQTHPYWSYRIHADRLIPFLSSVPKNMRSQDLPPAYMVNGAFYLITPELLRRERTFVPFGSRPFLMDDPVEAIDIDTEFDWRIAECLAVDEICRGSGQS